MAMYPGNRFVGKARQAWPKLLRLCRNTGLAYLPRPEPLATGKIALVQIGRLSVFRERFLLQLLRMLKELGYAPRYLIRDPRDLALLSRLKSDLVVSEHMMIINRLPSNTDDVLLVCDDERSPLLDKKWKAVLLIEFDLSRPRAEKRAPLYVPFPDRSVGWLKGEPYRHPEENRPIRLLFAGEFRGYRGRGIETYLHKMEREDVIDAYRQQPFTKSIESQAELELALEGRAGETGLCYFVDIERFRIPQERWYPVLSRADVFLCPPGVINPFSHNAVEAMAVGTIPLINYAEWFHPRLVDGLNCFTFTDRESLVTRLDMLMTIEPGRIQQMRKNVMRYYDEHLAPASFREKLAGRITTVAPSGIVNLVMLIGIADYLPRLTPESLAYDPS